MAENTDTTAGRLKDSGILFQTRQDLELRGALLKLTRFAAVFELYNPETVLRTSEVLEGFKIIVADRPLYSGKAVVRSLIHSGSAVVVCEATLTDSAWVDVSLAAANGQLGQKISAGYREFMQEWQKLYKVRPEYKLVLADMQTYFTNLRLWLDQVELGVRSANNGHLAATEKILVEKVAESALPTINNLFEQFEAVSEQVEEDLKPAHQVFMRRQLHPLLLCSPFAWRTFQKPLGYAGDYEMVNMIMRNAPEGESLFAKLIHTWFVRQPPALAHRNRITYLIQKISAETLRANAAGQVSKIFNLACGPAMEMQCFLADSPLMKSAALTLLDFNEETIDYVRGVLGGITAQRRHSPPIHYIKQSVYHLLKEGSKPAGSTAHESYDLVYCAGLFDYLSDQVCQRVLDVMYERVAPGGLLVATNVAPSNPLRNGMEYLLDWNLVYRTAAELKKVKPQSALPEDVKVFSDSTGVNVFLEVRKPHHA